LSDPDPGACPRPPDDLLRMTLSSQHRIGMARTGDDRQVLSGRVEKASMLALTAESAVRLGDRQSLRNTRIADAAPGAKEHLHDGVCAECVSGIVPGGIMPARGSSHLPYCGTHPERAAVLSPRENVRGRHRLWRGAGNPPDDCLTDVTTQLHQQ